MINDVALFVLLASGVCGCLFMLVAMTVLPSFVPRETPKLSAYPAVTILKPLHGDEPGLFDNLASFCRQDYVGTIQIVFGVTRADDPAIAVVERLHAAFPDMAIELVVDGRVNGSNPKVANLINMGAHITHDIVVLADSDIRVRPGYLRRIVGALESSAAAATVPYYGIAAGGLWSLLSRLMVNGHFLPGVLVSARLRLSRPCMGSTIALRRDALAAIGGFEAVADTLADDYEIGVLLARHGRPVAVLPFAVGHVCDDASFGQLWRHELRWAMTVRSIDPLGYIGWSVTHAFPLGLAALALGGGWPAVWLAGAALVCRGLLIFAIERGYGLPRHPYWLIPVRDLLSFAVFLAGFAARGVSWRGHRYTLESEGTLISDRRPPPP
ncbi:MAG: bacteriohopanetetrol glucosamine biosynthesis glycosyltransferase HpnI [Rhizobiales bacterium]|jgi:ceramide glucosyltransferase|nr:bacteriohopanetetrol glucosamine biosynthesis glycosyltransferase HpnI [Hyphomicrobiales bacterium]